MNEGNQGGGGGNLGAIRRALHDGDRAAQGGDMENSKGLARVGGGGGLQAGPAGRLDWDGAIRAVDTALERVQQLGVAEFNRPGDRQRVAELLGGVRSNLVAAAGAIREADGASAAVDARRRAVGGGGAS